MHRARLSTAALLLCALAGTAHAQSRRRPRRPTRPVPSTPVAPEPPVAPTVTPILAAPPVVSAPGPALESPPAPLPRPVEPRPRALELFVYAQPFARMLRYTDDVFAELRPYTLPLGTAVGAQVEWYPAAHFTGSALASFGLGGDFSYALGLGSTDASGTAYATTALRYSVYAAARVPLGAQRATELGLTLGYAAQRYVLESNARLVDGDPSIPAAEYQSLRAALFARIALGARVQLSLRGAYLGVLSSGAMLTPQYFSRGFVHGFDSSVALHVRVIGPLDLRLDLEFRRYLFGFDPQPGDRYIAGGAYDDYFTASLGPALRL